MSAVILQEGDSYLSAKSVQSLYDMSSSTFYVLRDKGRIPKPHYPISKDMPRYLKSEVVASMSEEL